MDKFRAMNLFCRVVESKSFSAAAQTLEMVPSALSKTVAALEQDLGFRLIHRSTRSLSLTDEGALYYQHCRQILIELEQAETLGRSGQLKARGTLRIGMHPALRYRQFLHLGQFLDHHPDLSVETVITNSASAVVNEGLDLVLHIGPLSDSNLVARRIGWAWPLLCASPAYLARHGTPQHPNDLLEHRAVIYARSDEQSNTQWSFVNGKQTCEVDPRARMTLRDGVGLVEAAVGGCGIARPFDLAARHLIAENLLCELLPAWKSNPQPVTAVTPAFGHATSAKVRMFLDHFIAVTPMAT